MVLTDIPEISRRVLSQLTIVHGSPRFKDGVETRGGESTEESAQEENIEVVRELAGAVKHADDAEELAHGPPSVSVCQGPRGAAQDTGGQVASHEEYSDVSLPIAVLSVQLVDVGALQPVREEGQEVGGEVEGLEAPQGLTGGFLLTAAPGLEIQ